MSHEAHEGRRSIPHTGLLNTEDDESHVVRTLDKVIAPGEGKFQILVHLGGRSRGTECRGAASDSWLRCPDRLPQYRRAQAQNCMPHYLLHSDNNNGGSTEGSVCKLKNVSSKNVLSIAFNTKST